MKAVHIPLREERGPPRGNPGERSPRQHALRDAPDLHLIFPPQWSPFQPFLSTPSLAAYLRERGHRIEQSDWNAGFYAYFISAARLASARKRLQRYASELGDEHATYRARAVHALAVLDEFPAQSRAVAELRDPAITTDVARFKRAVDSLQRLLDAFSVAEPVVEVGTSSLGTGDVMNSLEGLLDFIADDVENPFIEYFTPRVATLTAPRYFGVSIIGQEQIVPGLTLCRLLRDRFPDVPVIVGGSVFSRLVEKDERIAVLFESLFDYVCRYEGEQPMDVLLSTDDPRSQRTPNLAFLEAGQIVLTPLCEPLGMQEIPTPDFAGLAFEDYLSPEIVLPLLTTRGCYWGKCAFCYHGMIYQDRYRMRDPALIARDMQILSKRHGVRHFAFNDEALPPKLFRLLPDVLPSDTYYFTGLYKFEKYFQPTDYQRMFEVGCRSLYIGLETASERVQAHMLKNNLQSTMLANLASAHVAGIWNHTFLFFGFPTETPAEAEETIDFMLGHADIIHSEGAGTFSFEHNAPIHENPRKFGVSDIVAKPDRVFELYYDYATVSGLGAPEAQQALARFNDLKKSRHLYQTGRWVPREFLLILLSHHRRDALIAEFERLEGPPVAGSIKSVLSTMTAGSKTGAPRYYVVNKLSRQVFETNEDAVALLNVLDEDTSVDVLVSAYPTLGVLLESCSARAALTV